MLKRYKVEVTIQMDIDSESAPEAVKTLSWTIYHKLPLAKIVAIKASEV